MRQKKYHCVCFLLNNSMMGKGPILKYCWYSQWYFIKKANFSFTSGSQLQISSLLGMGTHVYFLLFSTGASSIMSLWRPWAWCNSICDFICASILFCLESVVSLESSIPSSSDSSFLFCIVSVPWGEECSEAINLGLSVTKSLILCGSLC